MYVKITSTRKIESKLQCLKIIKEITGLGLKESKDKIDFLCNRIGNQSEVNIINYDKNKIDDLHLLGVQVGDDREDNIDEILMKFRLIIPSDNIQYKVNEGEYKIEKNLLIVTIKDGKFVYDNIQNRQLTEGTVLKLDFRKCIIEDYYDQ